MGDIMNEIGTDIRIFKYLAYLPFMWLIGFFSPYKNDSDVKFHIGQGMILNFSSIILFVGIELLNRLIITKVFCEKQVILGVNTGVCIVSNLGNMIMLSLRITAIIVYISYIIIGFYSILNKKKNKLPFIGEYAVLR